MNQIGTHFGIIFESNIVKHEPERSSKKCFKKGYPPRFKRDPLYKPGGSWRRRLACAFSTTKTAAWTAPAAATATIAKTVARVQFLLEFVTRIRLFFDVVVRFQLTTSSNVCTVAPTTTKSW